VHATTGDRIVVGSALVGQPPAVQGGGGRVHQRRGTACVASEQPAEFCSKNNPTTPHRTTPRAACL